MRRDILTELCFVHVPSSQVGCLPGVHTGLMGLLGRGVTDTESMHTFQSDDVKYPGAGGIRGTDYHLDRLGLTGARARVPIL